MSDCCKRRIWRYKPPVESGLRARWWLAEAGPHLDPLEWTGPADYNGFPLPTAAAPDTDVINNANSVNDSNSGAGASRYGIIDGWVWLPNNVTHWRDVNGNTGELGMVLTGDCCGGSLAERPGGNHDVNTSRADNSLMDSNAITGGWHYIYSPQSDQSAFGGLQLEYSTDDEETYQPVTVKQPNKPEIEGFDISCCQDIPEVWSVDPLQPCCQPTYSAGGESLDAEAINAIVIHPPHPEQEICTGDFVDASGRTGWLHTWTPVYTANSGTIVEDWVQISTAETSPDCDTDITVNGTLGNSYIQLRNMWGRAWYDVRLLIGGAAVQTFTFQNYHYEDDIGNTNVDDDIEALGSFHFARASVPAGSVITVEMARRHNFVAGNAAVAAPFGRVISGLRAHFNVHYSPTQIVTGRI